MYCKNCGKLLSQGASYCTYCGSKVQEEMNSITQNSVIQNNQKETFSNVNELNSNANQSSHQTNNLYQQENFSQQQNVINNQNAGNNNTKKSKWKIMILLSIGVVVLLLVFVLKFIGSNPIVGTWNCKSYSSDDNKYVLTLKLEKNKNFKWNNYNDEKNNYSTGKYEFKRLNKNNDENVYYSIKLSSDKFVYNGVLQSGTRNSEYEMAIIKNSDEALLINANSYNMYYCYKNGK